MTKVYFLDSEISSISPLTHLADKCNVELASVNALSEIPNTDMALLPWTEVTTCSPISNIVIYGNLNTMNDEDKLKFSKLCSKSNIFGWIDLVAPLEFSDPLFRSIDTKLKERSRMVRLAQLGEELNDLTEHMDKEITRVKKIHENLIPVRSENLKGVEIFSKYAAGEASGGEFFDFYQDGNSVFFILSSSTSYLMSSTIISRLEILKSTPLSNSSMKEMVAGILEDAHTLEISDHEDRNALDLLTIKIDLISMSIEGHRFGGGEIVAKGEVPALPLVNKLDVAFIDEAYFEFGMQHSDKLVFLSSGIRHNTDGRIGNSNISDFIKKELANSPKELLNELFFQLKKDRDSDFLKHDASAIYIEVNRNGIFKV
ncbi:MAG: hypothetical protein KAG61_05700 [Bacteriovoracaceae bacterium]|nr:hypothetical protein [Bacteriovoracaceae bacterium]